MNKCINLSKFGFNFQSLLDLALRSTAAAADPLHEDVTCSVVGNIYFGVKKLPKVFGIFC